MKVFNMFITTVCVIFLIKLRWPKTKSLYDTRKQFLADQIFIKILRKPAAFSFAVLYIIVLRLKSSRSCNRLGNHKFRHNGTIFRVTLKSIMVKFTSITCLTLARSQIWAVSRSTT